METADPYEQGAGDVPPFGIAQVDAPDGTVLLVISGELDLASAPQLAATLDDLAAAGSVVQLDLSGVSFIDSTGLGAVVRAARAARTNGWRLTVCRDLQAQAARLFDIAGVWAELGLDSVTRSD
jgi:anti-sigma B factor antagonist